MTPISADLFPQLRLFAPRRTPSTPSALKATSEQKPLAENKVRNQVQIRNSQRISSKIGGSEAEARIFVVGRGLRDADILGVFQIMQGASCGERTAYGR